MLRCKYSQTQFSVYYKVMQIHFGGCYNLDNGTIFVQHNTFKGQGSLNAESNFYRSHLTPLRT